jgi:hypothetical protein
MFVSIRKFVDEPFVNSLISLQRLNFILTQVNNIASETLII